MNAGRPVDPDAVQALLRDLDYLTTDLHRALPRGGGPRMTIADVIERLEQMRLRYHAGCRPAPLSPNP